MFEVSVLHLLQFFFLQLQQRNKNIFQHIPAFLLLHAGSTPPRSLHPAAGIALVRFVFRRHGGVRGRSSVRPGGGGLPDGGGGRHAEVTGFGRQGGFDATGRGLRGRRGTLRAEVLHQLRHAATPRAGWSAPC